ncbi:MAG: pyridoxal 5'-phosphate synthase glutaminase subunit PdxT [Deltaproteobacteria bacterium]|nr:pyridoxal 5'-phosphate synthase glutaminase subunit PdxT [Deltaproteobacteria bacterium]
MSGDRGRRRVGVVAVQGAVEKHLTILEELDVAGRTVLGKDDLAGLDAVILPGGESTTISKGLERLGLVDPLRAFAVAGGAMLGTCAGAILLAREVRNDAVPTLGLLDVRAVRNAYGTQVNSFSASSDPGGDPELAGMRCVFIRAPQLEDPGAAVEVLLRVDTRPVLVREGRILASTFHPELAGDPRIHQLLLEL